MALVGITKCPEFTLDKEDAQKLGEATAQVLAYYKVKMTAKQEAYALLLEAAAQVYPPMLMSVYLRKKFEHEARQKATPPKPAAAQPQKQPPPNNNITPFPGVGHNGGPAFDPFSIRMPE